MTGGVARAVVVHSASLVDGATIDDAWVRFAGGLVVAVGTGAGWRDAAEPADEIVDAVALAGSDAILVPGFLDIHGHGGGGASYDDGAEAIRTARTLHRAHGTTRAVVSLVTAGIDDLIERLSIVADLTRSDPDILGSHLEGPFLDPAHHGAHVSTLLRHPASDTLERLLEAGEGTVRQVTLAPELPGGLDAVRAVVEAGAAAAVGHTGADADTAREAFDAGATILTHAFNAMHGVHHRGPGPVAAASGDPRVTLEVIADGLHVHDEVLRMLWAATPERIALVTDAMAAAGAPDGEYHLGALDVDVAAGVARVRGSDTIAGSTLTQDRALRRAVDAGVPLAAAVHAATRAPAAAIGRAHDLGRLARGYLADAVLMDAQLHVAAVWTAGRRD